MSIQKVICPVCESGSLTERTGQENFCYKDINFVIDDYLYSVCDECGYELVTATEAKLNEKKIREHHRLIDGLLSGSDIKRIRKKFDLTQHEAAEIFGGGANAFSKYENSDVIQSTPMDRLLRVAEIIPGVYPALVSIAAKQTVKFKTKQIFSKLFCNYGECEIADSRHLPKNIIHVGMFTEAKKKRYRKTVPDNWLSTVNS